MEPHQIIVLSLTLATFVGFGLYFLIAGRRLRWPEGKKLKRRTPGGCEVVVINAGGDEPGDASKVADACALALDCCFVTWNRWRPHDLAEEAFKIFGVLFMPDEELDRLAKSWWPGKTVNGYMTEVTREQWGSGVPLAVVRASLWGLVIAKGKPVVHEAVHALLGEFSREGVDRDHSHDAWKIVWIPAEAVYAERTAST